MKLLLLILFIFSTTASFTQTDTTIWNDMKKVEGDNYYFYVPKKWRDLDMSMYKMLHYYEASGLAFPLMYNGQNPVIVILTLVKMKETNLEEMKQNICEGYSENSDRVFQDNIKYETEEFILNTSEKAYLINTRFYRKSKGLHQSRFDLAIFSDKASQGYMFTISIQYYDESFGFEKEYKLKDFAKKFYSYFSLN